MKSGRRTALVATLSLALASVAVAVVPAPSSAQPLPRGGVTITRDSRGEPRIEADKATDAFYGFAWAQMEDRAPLILDLMSHSMGRSAELLGAECRPNPQANPNLQACFRQDQLAHLLRVPETAYERFPSLPGTDQKRLTAFASGINDYIASGADNVPSWAVRVTPQDVLANVQYRFVMSQLGEVSDIITRGGNASGSMDTTARAVAEVGSQYKLPASNMFALRGSKTQSGRPILQGDPHLPFDGVSRWYAAQIRYPGTRLQGITFVGLPGIALGSNDHIAWAHTANHNTQHEQDAYVETLNPDNPNQYLYGGTYRDMKVRTIEMRVKGPAGSVQRIPVTVRYTVHGPVISDPPATVNGAQPSPGAVAISAKVSMFGEFRLVSQLYRESEARSTTEFRAAMHLNQLSSLNTLVADDRNNIFFAATSRSGILNPGVQPNSLLNGSDPGNDWQGILPFAELPQAKNPASGYYQNANNAPWFTAPDQIHEQDLPFYLRGGDNTSRSRRLVQLLGPQTVLGGPRNLTLADIERIGLDTFLEFGPSLRSLLDAAAASPGADPRVRLAAAVIDDWSGAEDLRATKGSTAYPLFATWKRGLAQPALGFNPTNPPAPNTAWTERQKAEASRAMIAAFDGMVGQYGTITLKYGIVHRYTYGSVNRGVNGGDSDLATVRTTNCKNDPGSESPLLPLVLGQGRLLDHLQRRLRNREDHSDATRVGHRRP